MREYISMTTGHCLSLTPPLLLVFLSTIRALSTRVLEQRRDY
jgi:hypothetical protein